MKTFTLELDGSKFELIATFESLDKLEDAVGKPCYIFIGELQRPRIGALAKAILAVAKPIKREPDWFDFEGVCQRLTKADSLLNAAVPMASFIASVLGAGTSTDIKTVEPDEGELKK